VVPLVVFGSWWATPTRSSRPPGDPPLLRGRRGTSRSSGDAGSTCRRAILRVRASMPIRSPLERDECPVRAGSRRCRACHSRPIRRCSCSRWRTIRPKWVGARLFCGTAPGYVLKERPDSEVVSAIRPRGREGPPARTELMSPPALGAPHGSVADVVLCAHAVADRPYPFIRHANSEWLRIS